MSSLLGQTSRNLRAVFDFIASMPCILFLDEFDALAKDRNDSREIGELQRVVIAPVQKHRRPGSFDNPHRIDQPSATAGSGGLAALRLHTEGRSAKRSRTRRNLAFCTRQARSRPQDLSRLVDLSDGLSGAAIKLAANDMCRAAIKEDLAIPTLPSMLRRLARVQWYDSYTKFQDVPTEIAALRDWAPDVFTVRALSELFGVCTRQVSNAIGKGVKDA